LAAAYDPTPTPYGVKGGFFWSFGRDAAWWLTLVIVLFTLITAELTYRSLKRELVVRGKWKWGPWWGWRRPSNERRRLGEEDDNEEQAQRRGRGGIWTAEGLQGRSIEEWDVELWQEMEKDPLMKTLLHRMSRDEYSDDDNLQVVDEDREDDEARGDIK
jgi:phospholipid-translocating ATPase